MQVGLLGVVCVCVCVWGAHDTGGANGSESGEMPVTVTSVLRSQRQRVQKYEVILSYVVPQK